MCCNECCLILVGCSCFCCFPKTIHPIQQLLKLKRAEREEAEKVGDVEREIQRRMMGKEMAKTKEQLDAEQRKRETQLRKKEKADFLKERQRLREELARDKAERISGKGKLSSRLGVDGYKPDGIQYDVPGSTVDHSNTVEASEGAAAPSPQPKKTMADASKIDEYITKISSYRAGGDGGNCLKVLKTYVGNVVDNPKEEKYKSINMENKGYKTKVKPFIGAKHVLLACGFLPPENGNGETLVLTEDADVELLTETRAKLEAAFIAFNK
jgi:UBX domain-containing protein 1/4